MTLTTPLCQTLRIEHPIFSVGFAAAAGPALAAAVSNAGACGVLGSGGQPAAYIREKIRDVRALTGRPFGVNVILAICREGVIEACLDEAVPVLVLFWGDPTRWVSDAHRQGTKVFIQVGSVDEAKAAAAAGVDAIIAQGVEAGGHVRSKSSLLTLLPAVAKAVSPVPVIASGGIATGAGLVAALSLGAQGVSMGTRFVASDEAFIPRMYKDRIVSSRSEDTLYCDQLFDVGWPNAPHRVLRNRAVEEWEAAGRPPSGRRPGEGTMIGTVWAGESCGLVDDIKPAAAIVAELVAEAKQVIARLQMSEKKP
jgi:nitronate monooxygenase